MTERCRPKSPFWYLGILIAIGILVPGCSSIVEKPQVAVSDIEFTKIALSSITLEVTFSVDNPNPTGMSFTSLSFDVFSRRGDDWVYLAHGERDDIEISPGHNEVTIPVVVDNYEMLSSLVSSFSSGEITLQVEGLATTPILGIDIGIPFSRSFTVPLDIPWK